MKKHKRDAKAEFFKVFEQIPTYDRLKIQDAWDEHGAPTIELKNREWFAENKVDAPACTIGSKYFFREELFTYAPENYLEAAIAHELAHTADLTAQLNEDQAAVAAGKYLREDKERERRREQDAQKKTDDWELFDQLGACEWWAKNFGHE